MRVQRWPGNSSQLSKPCVCGHDISRQHKGVGDQISCWHLCSAHHPQPRHADTTELPPCVVETLGFPEPHPAILHVPTPGHTASRSHGSLRVYSACLQDAVGRSIGLVLCPNKGQQSDLHRDGGWSCRESSSVSPAAPCAEASSSPTLCRLSTALPTTTQIWMIV